MDHVDSLQFFEKYALVLLPALTVAEQVGIPLPAVPALLAVGALAAHGRVSITFILLAIAIAALAIDLAWYELGRRVGPGLLERLFRRSAHPEQYRRRAETVLARYGARSMLIAKFVPGLTAVMPPLAGIFAVGRLRFALYDLAGVLLWAGTWLSAGYFFSDSVASIAHHAGTLGSGLGLVAIAVIGYVGWKYRRRRRERSRPRPVRLARATRTAASDDSRDRRFLDAA